MGRVSQADRAQRLTIGIALMALNLIGLYHSPDWAKWIALAIQVELIGTGLAGWCPFYWACRYDARVSGES